MMIRYPTDLPVMLAAVLALSWGLSGCARGDWPKLGSVERPAAAPEVASPVVSPTEPAAPSPSLPAVSPAAGVPRDFQAELDTVQRGLVQVWARYEASLDAALSASREGVLFAEQWSDAQATLSRLNSALDDLRALSDQAAASATGQSGVAYGTLAAAADQALNRWRTRIMAEQNRLAVLTPPSIGGPGPNAIAAGGRTAFAQINTAYPDAVFSARLADGVRAVLAQVPDAAFDVVAGGNDAAAAQAAAQRVLWLLRQAGVDYDRSAVALSDGGADVPAVAIYLRKTSL